MNKGFSFSLLSKIITAKRSGYGLSFLLFLTKHHNFATMKLSIDGHLLSLYSRKHFAELSPRRVLFALLTKEVGYVKIIIYRSMV